MRLRCLGQVRLCQMPPEVILSGYSKYGFQGIYYSLFVDTLLYQWKNERFSQIIYGTIPASPRLLEAWAFSAMIYQNALKDLQQGRQKDFRGLIDNENKLRAIFLVSYLEKSLKVGRLAFSPDVFLWNSANRYLLLKSVGAMLLHEVKNQEYIEFLRVRPNLNLKAASSAKYKKISVDYLKRLLRLEQDVTSQLDF